MARPAGYLVNKEGKRVYALVALDGGLAGITISGLRLESASSNPIRAMRVQAKASQEQVAIAMGISQPRLSFLEQPERIPSPEIVRRAEAALRKLARPEIDIDAALEALASVLDKGLRRKSRDPVERRLLKAIGDPIALRESNTRVREAGARPMPPSKRVKA